MIRTLPRRTEIDYPTSDGKPMAETDRHRKVMTRVIELLEHHYADRPNVYVSGNLLVFFEEGNKRRHVSPDCFVVFGVKKDTREHYLTWKEGKGPDVVIEVTSKSTKEEDVRKKLALYRDVLRVGEYFLFDPLWHYLEPPLQGFRLVRGRYVPIPTIGGRLPRKTLGLHLDADGELFRLWNPATGQYLLTAQERAAASEQETLRLQAELYRLHQTQKNGTHKNGK